MLLRFLVTALIYMDVRPAHALPPPALSRAIPVHAACAAVAPPPRAIRPAPRSASYALLSTRQVPLPNPNEQPFGNLSVEHWSVTPQTTFHSVYAIVGAVALLLLIPLAVRRHALALTLTLTLTLTRTRTLTLTLA